MSEIEEKKNEERKKKPYSISMIVLSSLCMTFRIDGCIILENL